MSAVSSSARGRNGSPLGTASSAASASWSRPRTRKDSPRDSATSASDGTGSVAFSVDDDLWSRAGKSQLTTPPWTSSPRYDRREQQPGKNSGADPAPPREARGRTIRAGDTRACRGSAGDAPGGGGEFQPFDPCQQRQRFVRGRAVLHSGRDEAACAFRVAPVECLTARYAAAHRPCVDAPPPRSARVRCRRGHGRGRDR